MLITFNWPQVSGSNKLKRMLILLFYNDKNDEEAKTQKTPLHLQEETEEKVIPPSVLDGRMTFYIFSFSFFNGNFLPNELLDRLSVSNKPPNQLLDM